MTTRKPIIAGNWKMYKTNSEAEEYLIQFIELVAAASGMDILLCPPYTCLAELARQARDSNIRIGAQNMYYEQEGAFTGEIASRMLTDIGVTDVILGHSERRQYFGESNEELAKKIPAALAAGLRPILCVGETDDEREAGETENKIRTQIIGGLSGISSSQLPDIVIAYEPIWAIGTGKTATPETAQHTNSLVRQVMTDQFESEMADQVRILYGGSVKPDNIDQLMAEEDIDGVLVGGASLDPSDFARIVNYK
jgi:triosephosphate isomerase